MNYLFVTEGEVTEPHILEKILENFGFSVTIKTKQDRYEDIIFTETELSNGKNNVVIAVAPKNRIHDALLAYERENVDLHKLFGDGELFNGIYIIYDVDHTSVDDLNKAFSIHNDESDVGLLLVSSPCIEVLTDLNRTNELNIKESFREYKKERNLALQAKEHCNSEEYMVKNFNDIVLYFLDLNKNEFNETNIMEHPKLVIDKINKENIRTNKACTFRYFTTVLYVAIAHMLGLTKEIDNYEKVRDFFKLKVNYQHS